MCVADWRFRAYFRFGILGKFIPSQVRPSLNSRIRILIVEWAFHTDVRNEDKQFFLQHELIRLCDDSRYRHVEEAYGDLEGAEKDEEIDAGYSTRLLETRW